MPKSWRKCSLCSVDSFSRPDLVIFSTRVAYKTADGPGVRYICELHYQKEDIRVHGDSKRLVSGAKPSPLNPNIGDHSYIRQDVSNLQVRP